jgi:hypothetical protein
MRSVVSLRARSRCALAVVWFTAGTQVAGAQSPAGFSPLFEGSLGAAEILNGGTFTVENGILRAEGPNGWLRFPGLVRDFRMRVELRFTSDNGDSGVFFRALPDGEFNRGWPNRSYQVQVLNPRAGGTLPPIGGVFRHVMPPGDTALDVEAVRAAFTGTHEWQVLEIEIIGTELTAQLNGTPVTRAAGIADVAGYIGLQSETSAVEFRRIDIEVLEAQR